MKEKCEKCGKFNTLWVSGVKFEGLDEHHNPPQYMFQDEEISERCITNWKGKIYTLCRACHTGPNGLHRIIILPTLNKYSTQLKSNGSEHYLWNFLVPDNKKFECKEEVFILTKNWVETKKDDDTKTTTN